MVKRENAFSECLALFVEAHKDVEVVVKGNELVVQEVVVGTLEP